MVRQFLKNRFENPGSSDRVIPMEGMRGFAALLVFFVHFNALFRPYLYPGSWTATAAAVASSFGHAGVDLFFVLSGFLIYGIIIRKHPAYSTFLRRRVRRLYPVFVVVLGMYVALSLLFQAQSKLPRSISQAVVYIGANLLMLPGMTRIPAIITVAWSLSYEWFFYVTVPLLVAALDLRRWSSRRRIVLFLLLPLAYTALWLLGLTGNVRMILFAAGIVLWELVDQEVPRKLPSWAEYVVAVAFLVNLLEIGLAGAKRGDAGLVLSYVPRYYAPTLFVTLLPFCLYAMFFSGFLSRIFSWDYLRWIGNISYSYYLIHGLTLHGVRFVMNRLFLPTPRSALFDAILLAACVLVTILCAAVLYLLVEKPLSWSNTARKVRPPNPLLQEVPGPKETVECPVSKA